MSNGPPIDAIAQAVDWLELALVASNRHRLSPSNLTGLLRLTDPDLSDEDAGTLIEDIFVEVERRTEHAALYPFERGRRGLQPRSDQADLFIYLFLVLSASDPAFRKRPLKPYARFERITRAALAEWTGGEALVFSESGNNIREAVQALGDRLRVESFPHRARVARKDHGLDVAAWRPFRDGRAGLPVVLCQCTIARRKLVAKARDIQTEEWGDLLRIRSAAFTAAIAVPHVLDPDYEHWDELRRNTDLVLDRLRLLELLGGTTDRDSLVSDISDDIAAAVADWGARHLPA